MTSYLPFVVERQVVGKVFLYDGFSLFRQKVPFVRAESEIKNLMADLESMNPDTKGNFSIVKGLYSTFWLSSSVTIGSFSRLKCAQMDTQAINLQTFMKEKLIVNATVILADRIVTENGHMRCFLHSTRMEGTGCISTIRHWSAGTGLIFSDESDSDLYSFLVSRIDDKVVWHLTVNNTHLSLTMSPVGHVLCMALTSNDDTTDFADVVQRKYFTHLATLYRRILTSLSSETQGLKRYFANLVGLGSPPTSSASEYRPARPRLFDDHPDFWFDHIKTNDGRPKRWIWTSPLSALTGLAD